MVDWQILKVRLDKFLFHEALFSTCLLEWTEQWMKWNNFWHVNIIRGSRKWEVRWSTVRTLMLSQRLWLLPCLGMIYSQQWSTGKHLSEVENVKTVAAIMEKIANIYSYICAYIHICMERMYLHIVVTVQQRFCLQRSNGRSSVLLLNNEG